MRRIDDTDLIMGVLPFPTDGNLFDSPIAADDDALAFSAALDAGNLFTAANVQIMQSSEDFGHEDMRCHGCCMCGPENDAHSHPEFGVLDDPMDWMTPGQNTLPADIEAANNTLDKVSFSYSEAAAHIARWNTKWDDGVGPRELGTPGTIEWSFRGEFAPGTEEAPATYGRVDANMMDFVFRGISYLEGVADVSFTRLGVGTTGEAAFDETADLQIQSYLNYGGGWASTPRSRFSGDSAWTNTGSTVTLGETAGYIDDSDYGMSITIHELGHALGLAHPGDYNGAGAISYEDSAEYFEDSRQYSVMSYWSASNTGADHFEWVWQDSQWNAVGGYATNFLLHDIATLHMLYGANDSAWSGDTVYGFNSNTGDEGWTLEDNLDSIIAAVWDTGGIDTLDVSGFDVDADIDLREEAFSSFGYLTYNFSIAQGVVIENAIGGGGADTMLGNAANNDLQGNAGDDVINGADGNDTLTGGAGNDAMDGGAGDDTVYADADDAWGGLSGGDGQDMLYIVRDTTAGLNFAARGFENAEVRNSDGALLLTYATTLDGIVTRTVFDASGTASWTSKQTVTDIDGNVLGTLNTLDNGVQTAYDYDLDGSESWAKRYTQTDVNDTATWQSTTRYYNETDEITLRETLHDNGQLKSTTYDLNDDFDWAFRAVTEDFGDVASWNSIATDYLDGGIILQSVRTNDNGQSRTTLYDRANTESWAKEIVLLDSNDIASWDSLTYRYNDANQYLERLTINDNGLNVSTTYDRDDAFDWGQRSVTLDTNDIASYVSYTQYRNDANQTTQRVTVYDNGSSRTTNFDVDDMFDWDYQVVIEDLTDLQDYVSVTRNYINGDVAQRIEVGDNGVVETNNYDLSEAEVWSRTRLREDTDDVYDWTSITQYYDDSGAVYDTVYVYDDAGAV